MECLSLNAHIYKYSKTVHIDNTLINKTFLCVWGGRNVSTDLKVSTVASKYIDSLPIHTSQKIVEMNDDHFVFSLHVNVSEELIR